MGLEVIDKGIESTTQSDLLIGMNCRMMQGFFIGRALAEEAFLTFLQQQSDPVMPEMVDTSCSGNPA